jgi:hypothetical protein
LPRALVDQILPDALVLPRQEPEAAACQGMIKAYAPLKAVKEDGSG